MRNTSASLSSSITIADLGVGRPARARVFERLVRDYCGGKNNVFFPRALAIVGSGAR